MDLRSGWGEAPAAHAGMSPGEFVDKAMLPFVKGSKLEKWKSVVECRKGLGEIFVELEGKLGVKVETVDGMDVVHLVDNVYYSEEARRIGVGESLSKRGDRLSLEFTVISPGSFVGKGGVKEKYAMLDGLEYQREGGYAFGWNGGGCMGGERHVLQIMSYWCDVVGEKWVCCRRKMQECKVLTKLFD